MEKGKLIAIMSQNGAIRLSVQRSLGSVYRAYLIYSKTPIGEFESHDAPGGNSYDAPVYIEPRYTFDDSDKAVPYDGPGWDENTPVYDGDWYAYRVTPPDSWAADLDKIAG